MSRCPSDLQLELHLTAPERSALADHVASCARCIERLEQMRLLGEEFEREVFPVTVGAVERSGSGADVSLLVPRPPAGARWRWLAVAAPVAAAIAAALLLAYGPSWRARGLDLTVFVDSAGTIQPVGDGAVVPASAALRFRVRPGASCNLWVLSVNEDRDIVRLYPPKGDTAAEKRSVPPASLDLPAVAALDGRPGPQRIFAVCTKTPVPWNTVKTAAAEKLGAGADAVRSFRSIPGLPPGASQTTLLVEKRS